MTSFADLTISGWCVHLLCDWLLQNDWMARNKPYPRGLTHPASFVHAGIHLAGLLLVFPWAIAVLIAVSHWLIDLRLILPWWGRLVGTTPTGEVALHVQIWCDQVLHLLIIAGVAALLAHC